jgi:hypothetical protein
MRRLRFIAWVPWAAAAIYLIWLRWSWLVGHRQAALAVVVALGLIVAVFPLSSGLASKNKIESDTERMKLENDIRATIFQAIAGLAVFAGVFVAWSQSQATNMVSSQEQVAQAYGQAVSELGSSQEDVRIGGMYALEEIFKAGQVPNEAPTNPIIIRIRPAVFGLLTAYIRTRAPWPAHSPVCDTSASSMPALSYRAADIQEALNVLGGRGYGAPGEPGLFLEHSDLRNADLYGSFDDTDFSYSELANADFAVDTSLIGANFTDTDLCGANLATAVNYQGDDFQGAVADRATKFPKGFNPKAYGIVMEQ